MTEGGASVDSGGMRNMRVVNFSATPTTAHSVVVIGETLQVEHDYHPSPVTPNLYEVTVRIQAIGHYSGRVVYRRVMDWDIEPTYFNEYVSVHVDPRDDDLVQFSSNDGFANPSPAAGPSNLGAVGSFTDYGPADTGALFDLSLPVTDTGLLDPLTLYYGAADTARAAADALAAVDARTWSMAKPSTAGNPDSGSPNTFVFGVRR